MEVQATARKSFRQNDALPGSPRSAHRGETLTLPLDTARELRRQGLVDFKLVRNDTPKGQRPTDAELEAARADSDDAEQRFVSLRKEAERTATRIEELKRAPVGDPTKVNESELELLAAERALTKLSGAMTEQRNRVVPLRSRYTILRARERQHVAQEIVEQQVRPVAEEFARKVRKPLAQAVAAYEEADRAALESGSKTVRAEIETEDTVGIVTRVTLEALAQNGGI